MATFKGFYRYNVDHKGRINIPAKLRKTGTSTLHESFVVTRGLEGCLFLYPTEEWEKVEEKLRALPFTQSHNRYFSRLLLSNASDVWVDKQGRIAIPQPLIEFSKIKKEVLILGVLERIEIWDPEVYQKYLDGFEQSYEEVAERTLL